MRRRLLLLAAAVALAGGITAALADGMKYWVLHVDQFYCVTDGSKHMAHGDPILGFCFHGPLPD